MTASIREMLEGLEARTQHPRGALSAASRGRERPDPEDEMRPAFQRDRDRIVHCKSFRRLQGKTQVFLAPRGDHYRNRLTHTLEVAQVARSIARALRLNEMLVEAICMGHDLGHTPFGHAGERVLAEAVRAGFLAEEDVPADIRRALGTRHAQRLATLIGDVIRASDLDGGGHIEMSAEVHGALVALREFLYQRVYENPVVNDEFKKAQRILRDLHAWLVADPERLRARFGVAARDGETTARAVTDFVSGMTDRFALETWESIVVPRPWAIV